jgi:hypothetical protein
MTASHVYNGAADEPEDATSWNIAREVMATWYGLVLTEIKHGRDTWSIYYAVTGGTFSVLTAASASSDACV